MINSKIQIHIVRSFTDNRKWEVLMKKYECTLCGYIYDPQKGDPDAGIVPNTPFEKLPDDWVCPLCGAGKSDFVPLEE